jgi:hypothetical protein
VVRGISTRWCRVAAAGAGLVVEVDGGSRARVVDERDAPRVREAIETVLATPTFHDRARAIAATMAAAPPAADLLDTLLSL